MKMLSMALVFVVLAGCDSRVERWRVDAGIKACATHGGLYELVTCINSVVCIDGAIFRLERGNVKEAGK